jgi:hypothetical protein
LIATEPTPVWQDSSTGADIVAVHPISRVAAAVDPIVAIRGSACERPFRRIADVAIKLLELNSGAGTFGQACAVHPPFPHLCRELHQMLRQRTHLTIF